MLYQYQLIHSISTHPGLANWARFFRKFTTLSGGAAKRYKSVWYSKTMIRSNQDQ